MTERLLSRVLEMGAYRASVIRVEEISLDRSFRALCEQNACGVFGKNYTCPPDVGGIDELMARVRTYDLALVYQTVTPLEDSFDFEGMTQARQKTCRLAQALRPVFEEYGIKRTLHLGAGACGVCEVCGKRTGEPCRFPHLAMASLEAYGINVSKLSASASMKYINGQNTVTYFGTVLFSLEK